VSANRRWRKGFGGQGLVEYSLLLILIAGVVFATIVLVGPPLIGFYQQAVNAFPM
jgi:Flp pilus assembly pilin Flp